MRFFLLLVLLAFPLSRALAESNAYPTGLDLIKRCHALEQVTREDETPDAETLEDYGYCLGFVVGYVSGFAARDAVGAEGMFCAAAGYDDRRLRPRDPGLAGRAPERTG